MKFTRSNLFESIFFTIETNQKNAYDITDFYNLVKSNIINIDNEEVFKFQFNLTIETIIKTDRNKVIFSSIDTLKDKSVDIKKILIDIKNNKNIYDKIERDLLFNNLIEYL